MQTLVKQEHLLSIAAQEKSGAIWKSYMFDLKKGTMKFTKPTNTNLFQWEKTTRHVQVMLTCKPGPPGAHKGDHPPYTYVNMLTVKNISSMQISTDAPYQAGGQIPPTSVLPMSDQISSSMTD